MSADTVTVDRNELFAILREMYLMTCSENFESRDACVEIIGMIENYSPKINMPLPTKKEMKAFDKGDYESARGEFGFYNDIDDDEEEDDEDGPGDDLIGFYTGIKA